jgi:hypothetical protein
MWLIVLSMQKPADRIQPDQSCESPKWKIQNAQRLGVDEESCRAVENDARLS